MMIDDKWKWISLGFFGSILVICLMFAFINRNPFEFSIVADNNVVDISQNLEDIVNLSVYYKEGLVVCETKLNFYMNKYGDEFYYGKLMGDE